MKIVTVMNTQARGGAEFATLEMLEALIEQGHEAVLLSERPDIAEGTRVQTRQVDLGPKLSLRTWRSLLLRWPQLITRLRAELDREAPYDVLLLHYKKDQLLSRWLPRRLRPKVVWAEWGPVPAPMRKGLPRRMYLDAARRADVVMAISDGTRDSLTSTGLDPARVHVVPNAMRVDELDFSADGRTRIRAQLGIDPDAFVVGCVSRFHPKKRIDVVVAATAQVDGAHLILAGEGETEAALRAAGAPLGERLHMVETPGDEIADWLSAFDVSVFCPSPTEGAPRAVLLAMLAQRPPVSTGAEGVASMIGDGVGVITAPEHDPSALAEVLRAYQQDPDRRAREGAEARRRVVADHSFAAVAERIETLWGVRARPDGSQKPPDRR